MIEPEMNYHYTTSNISFIKIYKELKNRGVKNNKFFLKLYDKRLMKIQNPLQVKDQETRSLIVKEITRNPWYYYREICRIPVPGGVKQFELNLGNLATLFCMHNNLSIFLELPRQQGKTIGVAAGMSHIITFGTENSQIVYGNKAGSDAELNLGRTIDIIRAMPEWLQFLTPGKDMNNVKSFKSYKNKNFIKTIAAPKDPIQADLLGKLNV